MTAKKQTLGEGLIEGMREALAWKRGELDLEAVDIDPVKQSHDDDKVTVELSLDEDVIEAFKADGPDWEERINDALREAKKLPDRAA